LRTFKNLFVMTYSNQNRFRIDRQVSWILRLFVAYRPKQGVLVTTTEWRFANQHLVQQNAKGPPVYTLIVFLAFDYLYSKSTVRMWMQLCPRRNMYKKIMLLSQISYLWRHIIRCTAKCIRCLIQVYLKFAHSKISDTHVTVEV